MSRLFATLSTLLLLGTLSAQSPVLAPDPVIERGRQLDWTNMITLWGEGDQQATAIRNELFTSLFMARDLDRPTRERSWGTSTTGNRFGYTLAAGLAWTGKGMQGKFEGWRPMVSLEHAEVLGVRYTRDLYALTFFGNAQYAGRTADLSGTAHLNLRYQSLAFGLVDPVKGRYLQFGVVKGQYLNESRLDELTLFTELDGRSLLVDMDVTYWQSDTASADLSTWNGLGASISGAWSWTLDADPGPLWLQVGVKDLGFIGWSQHTLTTRQDSAINYEGFEVEDVFDLDAVVLGEDLLLDTLGLRPEHGGLLRPLPFRAHVVLASDPAAPWQAGIGLEHRYLPGFTPQATLTAGRRLGQVARVSVNFGHGGFGGFRAGIAGQLRLGGHVLADLTLGQVAGYVDPQQRGLGMALRLCAGW